MLYFTPNDRIMSTADVLFWLGHKRLLLAKLFYWARMIFPALWMMYAAFMRHSQLTPSCPSFLVTTNWVFPVISHTKL